MMSRERAVVVVRLGANGQLPPLEAQIRTSKPERWGFRAGVYERGGREKMGVYEYKMRRAEKWN
jgi:hypothetical protein